MYLLQMVLGHERLVLSGQIEARHKMENEMKIRTASWVIVRKETANAVNKEKYEAVPIVDYLNSLNGGI